MMTHHGAAPRRVRWRRLDAPGFEQARFARIPIGWEVAGELEDSEGGVIAQLRYTVLCDSRWCTRSAVVEGRVDGEPMRLALAASGAGEWTREGRILEGLAGALDIDLGFTPATNTLPIRRLGLAVGESAPVRSAWLRFPGLTLETLEQTYRRESDRIYRYSAVVDGTPFVARLETDSDDAGRPLRRALGA